METISVHLGQVFNIFTKMLESNPNSALGVCISSTFSTQQWGLGWADDFVGWYIIPYYEHYFLNLFFVSLKKCRIVSKIGKIKTLDSNERKQWEKIENTNSYYSSVKADDLIWNNLSLKYFLGSQKGKEEINKRRLKCTEVQVHNVIYFIKIWLN